MGLLSIERARAIESHRDHTLLTAIAALAVVMMMMRGYYWNIFGRGVGFWTANRISAIVMFAAIYAAPQVARRFRNTRE